MRLVSAGFATAAFVSVALKVCLFPNLRLRIPSESPCRRLSISCSNYKTQQHIGSAAGLSYYCRSLPQAQMQNHMIQIGRDLISLCLLPSTASVQQALEDKPINRGKFVRLNLGLSAFATLNILLLSTSLVTPEGAVDYPAR